MIEKSDITRFARHLFSRSRGYPDKYMMHPQREWYFIVASFFVVFVLGALHVWYWYQYYTSFADTITANEHTSIPTYHDTLVKRVHTTYAARQQRFDDYRNEPVATPAPAAATSSEPTDTDSEDADFTEPIATSTPMDDEDLERFQLDF